MIYHELFQRPGKVVNSLLEMEGDQLLVILCDAKGCHLADAFCVGQHVGVKARDKLIWRMKVRAELISVYDFTRAKVS